MAHARGSTANESDVRRRRQAKNVMLELDSDVAVGSGFRKQHAGMATWTSRYFTKTVCDAMLLLSHKGKGDP